ncbi:unnamed protein product, partial [Mesorhabditis spiculigera]
MELEIKKTENGRDIWVVAKAKDFEETGMKVQDPSGGDPYLVPFADLRLAPKSLNSMQLKVKPDDELEAMLRDNIWERVKVNQIKGEMLVVESADGRTHIVDIGPKLRLGGLVYRKPSKSHMQIQSEKIPEDIYQWFKKTNGCEQLEHILGCCIAKVDHDLAGNISVFTFDGAIARRAKILFETFFKDQRQRMHLTQRQETVSKMLSKDDVKTDAPFVEEFEVSKQFMGLAIGTQGSNIKFAKTINGVRDVQFKETEDPNAPVRFYVYADNPDAAIEARNTLEYTTDVVMVPRKHVGNIIGKTGKVVQQIVDNSGVIRVQIADKTPESEEYVPFSFTGTRQSINDAEFLINYQLQIFNEMKEIRDNVDELQRRIFKPSNGRGGFRDRRITNGRNHSDTDGHRSDQSNERQNGSQSNRDDSRQRNGFRKNNGHDEYDEQEGEQPAERRRNENGGGFRRANRQPQQNGGFRQAQKQ